MSTTINFDDLASSSTVSNQYSGVTFSSDPGIQIYTYPLAGLFGTSGPNLIGTTTSQGLDGTKNLYVDFAQAVGNLSFKVVGDNTVGTAALIDVYTTTGFAGQVNLVTDGNGFSPDLVDLSSFTNITRISINTITDLAGIGYDDFQFNFIPVAIADSLTTAQNTTLTINTSTLIANDTDADNPTGDLRITGVSGAVGGTVTLNNNGTATDFADDFIVFTPTTEFSGDGSFNYTLSDGSLSSTATVNIAIGKNMNGTNNNDNLTGTAGNDVIYGLNAQDIISGLGGDDLLDGGNGDDQLYGGDGKDTLLGGNGQDKLWGDAGDDILNGGQGVDTLTGGLGSDTFVLGNNFGRETISDFSLGQGDKIGLLGGLTFNQLTLSGNQIRLGDQVLAVVTGFDTNTLTAANFVSV